MFAPLNVNESLFAESSQSIKPRMCSGVSSGGEAIGTGIMTELLVRLLNAIGIVTGRSDKLKIPWFIIYSSI